MSKEQPGQSIEFFGPRSTENIPVLVAGSGLNTAGHK